MTLFSAIGSFFKGIWHAIDGFRKVLHLILLLVIFGILFAATRSSLPFVPGDAALVLAPEGRIVEQLSGDPLDRAFRDATGEGPPETRLQDLLDVIEAATDDDRISAMVLDLGSLQRAGLPALQDLGKAVDAFRASGKKVFAWGGYFDQRQYLLAAHADEVYLDPYGAVIVEGYGYFRQYLKGTADKLGVDVHVFKVGTHKSYPETFTRSDMSPEDREEAKVWLTSLWGAWKSDVATARGLEPQALQDYADKAGAGVRAVDGDLAQYALSSGLVDGLKSHEQFEEIVSEESGVDESEHSFPSVDWRSYLAVMRSERALHKNKDHNVGVVVASGEILDGEQPPGTVGGKTLSDLLRDIRYDDSIDAVVLRIDSPGGSMFASEMIRREIEALQEAGKPVVASMSSVAASGGYYIAARRPGSSRHPRPLPGRSAYMRCSRRWKGRSARSVSPVTAWAPPNWPVPAGSTGTSIRSWARSCSPRWSSRTASSCRWSPRNGSVPSRKSTASRRAGCGRASTRRPRAWWTSSATFTTRSRRRRSSASSRIPMA